MKTNRFLKANIIVFTITFLFHTCLMLYYNHSIETSHNRSFLIFLFVASILTYLVLGAMVCRYLYLKALYFSAMCYLIRYFSYNIMMCLTTIYVIQQLHKTDMTFVYSVNLISDCIFGLSLILTKANRYKWLLIIGLYTVIFSGFYTYCIHFPINFLGEYLTTVVKLLNFTFIPAFLFWIIQFKFEIAAGGILKPQSKQLEEDLIDS